MGMSPEWYFEIIKKLDQIIKMLRKLTKEEPPKPVGKAKK